jgi:hypothetical protein
LKSVRGALKTSAEAGKRLRSFKNGPGRQTTAVQLENPFFRLRDGPGRLRDDFSASGVSAEAVWRCPGLFRAFLSHETAAEVLASRLEAWDEGDLTIRPPE